LKRAGSSIAAAKVSDTMASTPGTDVNNRAPRTLRAMAGTCFSKRVELVLQRDTYRQQALRDRLRSSVLERFGGGRSAGEVPLHKAATA
jgi:hypothetical protein